jgi:hypothetical protein
MSDASCWQMAERQGLDCIFVKLLKINILIAKKSSNGSRLVPCFGSRFPPVQLSA